MKIALFLIFWSVGSVLSLLGNRRMREYKYYENPYLMLVTGIILSVVMSWGLIFLQIQNDEYEWPESIYHDCEKKSDITFEEEYLDENGNKVNVDDDYKVHHTYKIYTCRKCGKEVRREQLQ